MFKAGFFLHWTVAVGCDSSDLFQPTLFIHTDHQTLWWPGACMPSLILCHGVARLCGLTTEVTSCQNFISHYCILTRGVCLAFSKNEWHIKTCCNLTTQKKRHKTTSQEVLVEVSLRFNECRQKLLHHKEPISIFAFNIIGWLAVLQPWKEQQKCIMGTSLAWFQNLHVLEPFSYFKPFSEGNAKASRAWRNGHTHIYLPPLPAGSRPAHFNHHCQEHCNYQDPH